MTRELFPDAERLVIAWLAGDAEVEAAVPGGIGTDLPADVTYPRVRVNRTGGTPLVQERVDRPRLQLEAFGNTKADAWLAAETVRAAMVDLRGRHRPEGWVSDVVIESGPSWSPDPIEALPRYMLLVQLVTHAL